MPLSVPLLTRRLLLCVSPFVLAATLLGGCGGSDGPINYQGNGKQGVRGIAYTQNADGTRVPLTGGMVAASAPLVSSQINLGQKAIPYIVSRTTADAQGRYTLPLIAGEYQLLIFPAGNNSVTSDFGLPLVSSKDFSVKAQQYTTLDAVGFSPTP